MIRIALLALFALPLAAAPDEDSGPRQDWVEKDVKRIEEFRSALSAKGLDVESLVSKFGSIDAHDDVDAGFGVRRVHMHLSGGYTTIWIDLLAERGTDGKKSRVAELRARQYGGAPNWKALEPRLAKAWGEFAKPIENGFEHVFRDQSLASELRQRTAVALGGATQVEVPKELTASFALLTSPFEEVAIGSSYGEDGGPPPGRKEIEELAKAERWDLVQSVLRGINPEGRLYAAWVLRRRVNAPPNVVDARAIATLLALPGRVHTTHGCIQTWLAPADAIAQLENEK